MKASTPKPRTRLGAISEAEWQRTLVEMAEALGWVAFYTRKSAIPGANGWRALGPAGYPDLTLVHPRQKRVLWVECKAEKGRLSPAQTRWLDTLTAAGQEAWTWRPSNSDEAKRVLDGVGGLIC